MNNKQPATSEFREEAVGLISEEALNVISRSDYELNAPDTLRDQLANQELERQFKEGIRGEDYRIHIHRLVCIGMYVIGAIIILMILIRAFHFLSPERWHWLTDKENQDIERIIFGTVFISVIGKYFKKYNLVEESSSPKN